MLSDNASSNGQISGPSSELKNGCSLGQMADAIRFLSMDAVQNANSGHRPYLHPIIAPDGNGSITEYSPGHHKHQTGLYWGFTRINGNNNLIPEDKLLDWFYSRDYKQFKKSDGTWDKTERSPEKKKKNKAS